MKFKKVFISDIGNTLISGAEYKCKSELGLITATFNNNPYEYWWESGGKVVCVTEYLPGRAADNEILQQQDGGVCISDNNEYWAYGFFLSEPPLSLGDRLLNLVGWYKVVSWWRKLTDTKGPPFNF